MHILIHSLIACVILLSGCGEITYKRGGDNQAFLDAQQECHKESQSYQGCMDKLGWTVIDMRALNPDITVFPEKDNRQAAQGAAEHDEALTDVPLDASVVVSSWWKFGEGPEGLRMALKGCAGGAVFPEVIAASGSKGYLISGGQLLCMRKAGWYGQFTRN